MCICVYTHTHRHIISDPFMSTYIYKLHFQGKFTRGLYFLSYPVIIVSSFKKNNVSYIVLKNNTKMKETAYCNI